MDVEQLRMVLQQSLSGDAAIRKPAQEKIRNLKNKAGAVQLLLQVTADKEVDVEVREAAAVQLETICREKWVETTHSFPPAELSEADKQAVKTTLVPTLLEEPEESIRDLLAETLLTVVVHDFPDKWPQLIPSLLSTIQNGMMQNNMEAEGAGLKVHNALLALRKVCKRYGHKSKEQRGPLNEIVQASFPMLLPLAQQLSAPNQHSLEAAMMLKQILKIFWSSTQFYLPGDNDNASSYAARPDTLQPWFDVITAALKKPLPEDSAGLEPCGQPVDVDERNAWPWWKVKKWAVKIMCRLFSRYGIPSYADDESAKQFAVYFCRTAAPQFLEPVCEMLKLRPTRQFCTDRVVHLCLMYVDLAVRLPSTYKFVEPHLDFLLYQVCFPTMCQTKEDMDCCENDPVKFVRKQNSPPADFNDPCMLAITLVTDLVKYRGHDVAQNLLGRMREILNDYAAAPVEQKNHVAKDAALLTLGALAKFLLAKEKYAAQVEGLLVTSVFPDFNSPIAFFRLRACWMAKQYSTVEWSDDGSHLRNLLRMVSKQLSDPALPVQIEASKALRYLIEANGAEDTLLRVLPLPQLLNEYFRIMNEIDNDEVLWAVQVLLEKFGDNIEPHAVALVTQLSNTFDQYCTAGEDDNDNDNEAALAAVRCLKCISKVLEGVCRKESMLKTLEPLLLPLVLKILGNGGDFLEESVESALVILDFLTYCQTSLSTELWQAFPKLYIAFDPWAYQYLYMIVSCLKCYIAKTTEVFLNGTAQLPAGNLPYIYLVFSMASKTVLDLRATESEYRYVCILLTTILHNCRGEVDFYIPFINGLTLAKLEQQWKAEIPLTRISIYQVLGSALYYNPQLELKELETRGVTRQVFSKWIEDINKTKKRLLRKLTVLGFSKIFTIRLLTLPPSVTSLLSQMIETAVRVALALKEESDLDQDFAEVEDVTKGNWDYVDKDYTSPIDQVDELILLSDALKSASQREPEVYQEIQAALPSDASRLACQKVLNVKKS